MNVLEQFFGKGGAGHFLTTDAFSNLVKTGIDLTNLYQSHKLFQLQKDMAKQEWAMNKDIFNREKKQEEWRHQLKF